MELRSKCTIVFILVLAIIGVNIIILNKLLNTKFMRNLYYLLLIGFYSCNSNVNDESIKPDIYNNIAKVKHENKYTIQGADIEIELCHPANKVIDSIKVIEYSRELEDFSLVYNEGMLISDIRKIGNFGYVADLYSEGLIYKLYDTIKVRKPRVVFENQFGYYFISNIDNKFSISVPGFIDEEIKVETNCEYTMTSESSEPKTYIIHPNKEESITIRVNIKMKNGNKIMFAKKVIPVIDKKTKFEDLLKKQ